ncbi:MAG: dimethyl sulfoxide reductase anchor subunit family protein, partial [Candidatus Aminicenantales bacterium]
MAGEWALVAFTITGQLAVGIYAFIGGPLFLGAATPGIAAGGARLAVVLAVLGCLAVATGLSLFHLHHPFRAYKIFSNLGTSWLSREIFFELLFLGIAGLLGLREWRGAGGAAFAKVLFVLGGLAGGLFILAMSRLYMLPAIAPWNHAYTPLSFCLTSFVLGALASAVFFSLSAERPDAYRVLPAVSLVS